MMQPAYESIEEILRGFAARKGVRLFMGRMTGFLAILVIVLLAGIAVKYLALQHPWLPLLHVAASFSALGLALFLAVYPLVRRMSLEQAALDIQEGHPELRDDLINAVQIYRQFYPSNRAPGISELLAAAQMADTAGRLKRIDLDPLLKKEKMRPGLTILSILLVAISVVGVSNPRHLSYSLALLLNPGAAVGYRGVTLRVKPGDVSVLKGSRVLIEASYSDPLQTDTWLLVERDGKETRQPMTAAGKGSYKFELKEVSESVTYRVKSSLSESGPFRLTVVEPPMVGKLGIRLVPPAYTGLEARDQEDSGNITAYPGTEAVFSITPVGKLSEAALVFDGREPLPLHQNGDGVWQGRVVLISQGGYHVELKDLMGFSNPDPVHYRVEMAQDLPPQVEIVSPARDLELNEGDELPLAYVGKDDFRISSLHLKYTTEDGELKSIKIAGGADPLISGQYMWQLVGPEFSHGNLITYYLEVMDNDTISGPHTGVSRTYTLRIKGREEEHRRIEENIASIIEDLLWLLGDQLEEQDRISRALASTNGRERNGDIIRGAQTKRDFQKRLGDIVREVDDVMAEMAVDPLSGYLAYFNLQALRKNLDYLARTTVVKSIRALERAASGERGAEEARHLEERLTEGLEQAVLLAEDAGKESRAADLADLSSDMLREQGDLMDMLRRLMETGDKGAMEELDQQLARLQDMLSKFMEKLSEFVRTPPEEFLNSESLRSLDMGQLQELLREMQDAFQRGDMKKAMKLAERFMDSLSKLMAMLQEMSSMAMGRFQQFQETTNSVVDELRRIIEGQKSVLAGTESVHDDMTERLRKLQLERGSELSRSVREQLNRMIKALDRRLREGFKRGEIDRKDYSDYDSLKRRMNDIVGKLNKGDPSGFLEAFQGLSAELRMMAERLSARSSGVQGDQTAEEDFQKHLRNLNALARELGSLSPGPQHLTEDEGLRLKELSADQNGLRKDTDRLAAFLRGFSQLLPTLLPEIADNLSGAESEMDRSAGKLYKEDSGSALPSQREALFLLKKAMDQLQEAVGQLSAAASLKGMPMPMLMGQQAPFPIPFGFMPNIGYSEGGRLGHTLRPFKIPTGEDYEVPRLLREEVLEALKEGYPGKYKEEVGEYFRNLSR